MAQPWFELKNLVRRHGLVGRSSQYCLYGEVSNRVLDVMRTFSPVIEPYSIDENFISLDGMGSLWSSPTAMGRKIGETIQRDVGIPTCTGIGPTKTLAKLANAVAKKRPKYGGVLDIISLSDADLNRLLDSLDVGETWGIGSRIEAKLVEANIRTVNDLRRAPLTWIRKKFGVVVERTVCELRGIACVDIEETSPAKKQIVSSRTFGKMVFELDELCESVATYMSRAAVKLRAQHSVAAVVQVFIQTNRFRQDHDQYANCITVPLTHPSNDTRVLIRAATHGLRRIFRDGYLYKKTGVILSGISQAQYEQAELFDDPVKIARRERAEGVMLALDALNQRYGHDTVKVAAAGTAPAWKMRAEMLSPAFTTKWAELPKAFAQ